MAGVTALLQVDVATLDFERGCEPRLFAVLVRRGHHEDGHDLRDASDQDGDDGERRERKGAPFEEAMPCALGFSVGDVLEEESSAAHDEYERQPYRARNGVRVGEERDEHENDCGKNDRL